VIKRLFHRIRLLFVHYILQSRHFGRRKEMKEGILSFFFGNCADLSRPASAFFALFLLDFGVG
jgi:hypothetical protein